MKESTTQKIFQLLVKDIFDGSLKPGERLIETELAERYGFSRGPLREVFRKLEAKRLITMELNIGAKVVDLSDTEIIELYYVREALEGMSARLASENMSKAEISKLISLVEASKNSVNYPKGYVELFEKDNLDFHQKIAEGSKNLKLVNFLFDDLYYLLKLYRRKITPIGSFIHATDQHLRILMAIENRDGELAEMLMRRHIKEARDNILKQVKANTVNLQKQERD